MAQEGLWPLSAIEALKGQVEERDSHLATHAAADVEHRAFLHQDRHRCRSRVFRSTEQSLIVVATLVAAAIMMGPGPGPGPLKGQGL